MVMSARIVQRGNCDVLWFLAIVGSKEIDFQLLRQNTQLLNCSGSINVAADQQYLFLLLIAQQFGELAAGGRFTRAL
jgi:fructose-1,6-bisphosphatase